MILQSQPEQDRHNFVEHPDNEGTEPSKQNQHTKHQVPHRKIDHCMNRALHHQHHQNQQRGPQA